MTSKLDIYKAYLSLSEKQRNQLLTTSVTLQEPQPNPLGDYVFPDINFIDFQVCNQKGKHINLATYRYPAQGKAKAVVIMFHGLNHHVGYAAHIAHQFSKDGVITVGFDYRGFGRSEGTRGYIENIIQLKSDCLKFTYMIKEIYPQLPMFCMGYSLGGMSAYYLTLTHWHLFQGAILMAPAIKKHSPWYFRGAIRIMKNLLPEYTSLFTQTFTLSYRNPTILEHIKSDPLVYKQKSLLATWYTVGDTLGHVTKTFKSYRCPFLAIQGGIDRLVDPMGVFDLYQESPLEEKDKDVIFVQDMWHGILHDPEIFRLIKDMRAWIDKRLK